MAVAVNPAPSGVVAPPPERPRVLLVGTAFATVATFMVFVGLVAIYLSQRATVLSAGGTWVPAGVILPFDQPNVILFTLLMSAVSMQWVVSAIKNDDRTNAYLGLGLTLLLAFAALIEAGYLFSLMKLDITKAGQSLLILVLFGAVLAMVVAAMIFTLLMGFRALAGQFTSRQNDGIVAAALYWHSMVAIYALVWYVIFVTK